jgi:hypothetical protein
VARASIRPLHVNHPRTRSGHVLGAEGVAAAGPARGAGDDVNVRAQDRAAPGREYPAARSHCTTGHVPSHCHFGAEWCYPAYFRPEAPPCLDSLLPHKDCFDARHAHAAANVRNPFRGRFDNRRADERRRSRRRYAQPPTFNPRQRFIRELEKCGGAHRMAPAVRGGLPDRAARGLLS